MHSVIPGLDHAIDIGAPFADRVFAKEEDVLDGLRIIARSGQDVASTYLRGLGQPWLPGHGRVDLPRGERCAGLVGIHDHRLDVGHVHVVAFQDRIEEEVAR